MDPLSKIFGKHQVPSPLDFQPWCIFGLNGVNFTEQQVVKEAIKAFYTFFALENLGIFMSLNNLNVLRIYQRIVKKTSVLNKNDF